MEKPYCIQRAKFDNSHKPDKKGIDKLLQFDYMGSAEFEGGALPASLKRVRKDLKNYIMFKYSFKKFPSKSVMVYCKKEQYDFIGDILEELSEGNLRLQEYCDLQGYVNPKKENSFNFNMNDFWWDIDQDWFFWKTTTNDFDNQFKEALFTTI